MMRPPPGGACAFALAVVAASLWATPSLAEKADREKTINFSAEQPLEIDIEKRSGTAKGNVVITQGTITIKADRIDFKQNADNTMYATAYGNPVAFRQKKDDSDEYYEGFAQKAVYDGSKEVLELFDRGLLKDGKNELRGNYIWYNNSTSQMRVEGRPDAPNVTDGPGNRVRGTFEPHSDSKGKDDAGKDAKSSTDAKDKGAPKDKASGKSASPDKSAPLTLKPADEPSK
jgi:lipopolysaccharide export system protein LptA